MERGRRGRRNRSFLTHASSPHGSMSRKVSGSHSRFPAVQGREVCIRAYLRMSQAGQGERAEWDRNLICFVVRRFCMILAFRIAFVFTLLSYRDIIEVNFSRGKPVSKAQIADGDTFITIFCTQPTVRQSNFSIHVTTRCDTEGEDYAVHTLNQAMKSTCTTGWHP